MIADYQPFVERMISRYEGGYGWDAADPGGPTKYGITCYDLAKYQGKPMNSMAAWAPIVKAMPLSIADAIYAVDYAAPMQFNELGPGKDCVVFDFGVNSGVSRSVRFSQIIVDTHQDGIMGPITLAAVNGYDPAGFVNKLCDMRLRFLQGLPTWDHFGGGWGARVSDLRAYCLNLIAPKMAVPLEAFVDKPDRIPLAFAKGY